MATRNVSVPDPMRDWVQSRIDSGQYASASNYVRDLIRRDRETILQRQLSVEDIRRSIEESRAEGSLIPADDVFDRLEAQLKRMTG